MNDVLYTIPYYNAGMVLVSPVESRVAGMNDLSGRALAYGFGSEGDAVARRWLRRIAAFQTQPYELPGDALDAARLAAADAALVDATSAYLYLRDHPDWLAEPHYITDALYAIATRLDRGTTWDAVNRALIGLADDGTLHSILERWL
jgi:ABC-type amino acid transport substrate-binding protein